ncbi:hypothetical protein Plhal703r1_c25g0104901 [Plasmopara halstedii]
MICFMSPDNNFFTMMPMQDKVMQVGMQELFELFLLRHVRRYSDTLTSKSDIG